MRVAELAKRPADFGKGYLICSLLILSLLFYSYLGNFSLHPRYC